MTWTKTRHGFYWFAGAYVIATSTTYTLGGVAVARGYDVVCDRQPIGSARTIGAAKALAESHARTHRTTTGGAR